MLLIICLTFRGVGGKGEAEVGSIILKRKITDISTPMENALISTCKSLPKTTDGTENLIFFF